MGTQIWSLSVHNFLTSLPSIDPFTIMLVSWFDRSISPQGIRPKDTIGLLGNLDADVMERKVVKRFCHVPKKLGFSTRFEGGSNSIAKRTVSDFWQWGFSDLLQNTTRGILAEYIVAFLLGVDDHPRHRSIECDPKKETKPTTNTSRLHEI